MKQKLQSKLDKIGQKLDEIFRMNRVDLFCRSIRFWFQRCSRGWDDRETWNFDVTIANFVLPRLRCFRHLHAGCPGSLSEEKWNEILDKMIFSFERCSKKWDEEWDVETCEKIDDGLSLFAKWFHDLWW